MFFCGGIEILEGDEIPGEVAGINTTLGLHLKFTVQYWYIKSIKIKYSHQQFKMEASYKYTHNVMKMKRKKWPWDIFCKRYGGANGT